MRIWLSRDWLVRYPLGLLLDDGPEVPGDVRARSRTRQRGRWLPRRSLGMSPPRVWRDSTVASSGLVSALEDSAGVSENERNFLVRERELAAAPKCDGRAYVGE